MSARTEAAPPAGPRTAGGVVLELETVTKVYPGQPPVAALSGVSLSVVAGELVEFTVETKGTRPDKVVLHYSVDGGRYFAR